MQQVPILILSDCPSQSSGLARITRDLATLLSGMPEFRVATLGMQGTGSSRLPFHTYHLFSNEFGELSLPMCWDEFSQGEPGILFTVWDLSRLMWLARPEFCEQEDTREWLLDARRRKLRLWSYVPVDSTGPHNRLTTYSREVLLGIDRIIAYSPWGMGIIRNTIGEEEVVRRGLSWAPHGLNLRTFTPRPISNNVISVNKCIRVQEKVMPIGTQPVQPEPVTVTGGHRAETSDRICEAIVDIEPQGEVQAADNMIVMPSVGGGIGDIEHQSWCASRLSTGLESNAGTCTCRVVERFVEGTVGADPRIVRRIDEVDDEEDAQTSPMAVVHHTDGGRTSTGTNTGADAQEGNSLDTEAIEIVGNERAKHIGIVMTNQARKDWGLAAATCAGIVERLKGDVQFWWHTQLRQHVWNLDALIADFQLGEYVELTTQPVSDGWLAEQYRRCDLTLLPSLGEGMGYPLFESLACGVPVIHGDYAGGASIMSTCGLARYLIQPVAWSLEGAHNCLRPVYEPADWVNAAIDVLAIKPDSTWLAGRVAHLSYLKLGYVWQRWFREGLGNEQS